MVVYHDHIHRLTLSMKIIASRSMHQGTVVLQQQTSGDGDMYFVFKLRVILQNPLDSNRGLNQPKSAIGQN